MLIICIKQEHFILLNMSSVITYQHYNLYVIVIHTCHSYILQQNFIYCIRATLVTLNYSHLKGCHGPRGLCKRMEVLNIATELFPFCKTRTLDKYSHSCCRFLCGLFPFICSFIGSYHLFERPNVLLYSVYSQYRQHFQTF